MNSISYQNFFARNKLKNSAAEYKGCGKTTKKVLHFIEKILSCLESEGMEHIP